MNPHNREGKTYFRQPDKVENRILYGLMLVEGITTKELAKMVDVSQRSVERWCFSGVLPTKERQEKISKIFDLPTYVLFREVQ